MTAKQTLVMLVLGFAVLALLSGQKLRVDMQQRWEQPLGALPQLTPGCLDASEGWPGEWVEAPRDSDPNRDLAALNAYLEPTGGKNAAPSGAFFSLRRCNCAWGHEGRCYFNASIPWRARTFYSWQPSSGQSLEPFSGRTFCALMSRVPASRRGILFVGDSLSLWTMHSLALSLRADWSSAPNHRTGDLGDPKFRWDWADLVPHDMGGPVSGLSWLQVLESQTQEARMSVCGEHRVRLGFIRVARMEVAETDPRYFALVPGNGDNISWHSPSPERLNNGAWRLPGLLHRFHTVLITNAVNERFLKSVKETPDIFESDAAETVDWVRTSVDPSLTSVVFRTTVAGQDDHISKIYAQPLLSSELRAALDKMQAKKSHGWEAIEGIDRAMATAFRGANLGVLDVARSGYLRVDSHADPLHFCVPGPVDHYNRMLLNAMLCETRRP